MKARIENKFPLGSFTSNDILECYEDEYTESIKLSIPIIAILDTNSDPEGIEFPIPGNDDARRSIDLYCSLIKETIVNAKKAAPNKVEENINGKNEKIERVDKKNQPTKKKEIKKYPDEKSKLN